MENLYTISEFLMNCEIDNTVIDNIVEKFNEAFANKDEIFNTQNFSYLIKKGFSIDKNLKNVTSFNAVDNTRKIDIIFPLYENLVETRELIKQEDKLKNYYGMIRHLQKTYNVEIKDQVELNELYRVITNIKKPKIQVDFSKGFTAPNGQTKMFSNYEKLVKVVDAVSHVYTYNLFNSHKEYYPTKVKFCTQLVSDYILLTKLKFPDELVKHKICKAVGLQLCNKLNACDISELGVVMPFAREITEQMTSMLSENEVQSNKDFLTGLLKKASDGINMAENKLNLQKEFFEDKTNNIVNTTEEEIKNNTQEDNKTIQTEEDIKFKIDNKTDDLHSLDFVNPKSITGTEKKLLEAPDATDDKVFKYLPSISADFKEKTYFNAFDKMLNRILQKKAVASDNKIINSKNETLCQKNRRVRQFLAFFYLKFNLFIYGNQESLNVDKYYFEDLTLSDESKAFELAQKMFGIRNNIVGFIKANNDFMSNMTPKQKMNYVASLSGNVKLDSYVKKVMNDAIDELLKSSKKTREKCKEEENIL